MYISIDVGGTNMRVALVDLAGEPRVLKLESHPVNQDYTIGIDELSRHIEVLSTGRDIQGIGACFPGIIDENDMQVIGDPAPDLTGEIFTELRFKRISLQASLGFSVGNDVFNYLRYTLENMSTTNNQTTAVVNRWRYQGQATEIPRAAYGDPMQNSRFSDRWIEDGSYARLKRVSLTYRLPVRSKWVHSADLFATGINLLTFTKYLGLDPEFSLNGFALSQGIDVGMIPQNEMVLLGVKLGL